MFRKILNSSVCSLKQIYIPRKNNFQNVIGINIHGVRTLYSAYSLGLEGFLRSGADQREEIGKREGTFVKKMEAIHDSIDENMIVFTEDLHKLISLCQNNQGYINLVIGLSQKYGDSVRKLNIKPFVFGPPIMRLIHIHRCSDEVVNLLLNSDTGGLFHQATSYQLAMDLLYEEGRYEDVLKLMDDVISRKLFSFPTSCLTLAVASNYKLETDESLESSLNLIQKALEERKKMTFKIVAFVSALALKKQKPQVSLEILSQAASEEHFVINNLKILSLAQLGEMNDVLDTLRIKTLIDSPRSLRHATKQIYCHDVIDQIEKLVTDTLEVELVSNFKHIKGILQNMKLIDSRCLEESVCMTIDSFGYGIIDKKRQHSQRSYHQQINI